MYVWGKLLGAGFGFMFGGVFGSLLGMMLGHSFDIGFSNLDSNGGFTLPSTEQIKSQFFEATFSVMGHLARADGVVTPEEIKMATKLMDEMKLSSQHRMVAIELFRKGKRKDFNLDLTLKSLKMACGWRYDLLQIFMEIQFQAAYSDGNIKPQEKDMLMYLCRKLGFSEIDYIRLETLYTPRYNKTRDEYVNCANKFATSLEQAFKILGVDNDISENSLKRAYRKLMSQHHPDKLIAKGLPEEMLQMATEKTQEIKSAYEQIKLAKGWR